MTIKRSDGGKDSMVVIQGVFDLVTNLQEGAFLLFKNSLTAFLLDKPPKEEHDACIFPLLLLCSCSVKEMTRFDTMGTTSARLSRKEQRGLPRVDPLA
jgi:hypothetical protein